MRCKRDLSAISAFYEEEPQVRDVGDLYKVERTQQHSPMETSIQPLPCSTTRKHSCSLEIVPGLAEMV